MSRFLINQHTDYIDQTSLHFNNLTIILNLAIIFKPQHLVRHPMKIFFLIILASCAHQENYPITLMIDEKKSAGCDIMSNRDVAYKYPLQFEYFLSKWLTTRCNVDITTSDEIRYLQSHEKERISKMVFVWSDIERLCVEKKLYKKLMWNRSQGIELDSCEAWEDQTNSLEAI